MDLCKHIYTKKVNFTVYKIKKNGWNAYVTPGILLKSDEEKQSNQDTGYK